MSQISLPAPAVPRSAASAAAAMVLGAGLAYAGTAHAGMPPQPGATDAAAPPAHAAMAARERGDSYPVAAARGSMAGWKPVAHEKLDDMRGGFEMPGLQVSFGIERAVYINGDLVVATSINIPDVSRITADQAARLAATLGPAIVASTNAAVANALAGNPVTADAAAAMNANGAGAAASASGGAQAGGAATAAANGGTSASASTAVAAGVPTTVASTATGQVVTNGLLNVIQNGPGNAASVGALAGTPVTVIQNTLNNQSIRSLMTIDASVNTLQAFRSQLANTALNNALLRAASMR
ncbi:flagellin [Cupriavidus alkaliphilus]|uniref:Negative regulator of sigma E activity n=1 Tax=Cupriavidus alkaliphilus TaxID=942866 RepID=A0A7W4V888_9BURK|nr:flagellin [Cupriavidus alkaliphilus]MBB3006799.1 negative regulator of sigma E activity [Cupriavidus alkaliphilus]